MSFYLEFQESKGGNMGELFGHTKKANFYAYSVEAFRKITNLPLLSSFKMKSESAIFSTKSFVKAFNDIRQWRDPGFDPNSDLRNTAANDSLCTLVKIGMVERKQKGIYRLCKNGGKAKQFNKVYPDIKDPNRRERMKKVKEGGNLTKLGSQKTEYKLDGPDISILETFENKHLDNIYLVTFTQERDEFTARCPVTSQPDFGRIEILYIPNGKMVESKSLKLYFFSFRDSGEFHEDVTNRIFNDLWKLLQPKYLRVIGDFAARGGIAIKPLVENWEKKLNPAIIHRIERLITSWDVKNALR